MDTVSNLENQKVRLPTSSSCVFADGDDVVQTAEKMKAVIPIKDYSEISLVCL